MANKKKTSDSECSFEGKSGLAALFRSFTHRDLLDNREFFQAVLDGIQDSIKIVDEDYKIVYANRASGARIGKDTSDMLGKACYNEAYKFDKPCSFCHTSRTFKNGETEVSSYDAPGADGSTRYSELTSYPIKDEAGQVKFVIEITKDVTERKRLEQQLLHSERLASMGTLASSLAHEINNPLSVILGFAQDLLTETSADDPRMRSLQIIEQEALRCGQVLQRLLRFTRAHPLSCTTVDLGDVLSSVAELTRPQAKKFGVQTRVKLAKNLPSITGDANQLEQVFLNLTLNAIQAMPQGGKLGIQADTEGPGQVRITVCDTGEGIDAKDMPHVFEPFFSNKGVLGTGLGLSITQRIVTDHHGAIRLESEPSKGTKAIVTLPIAAA